MALTPEQQQKLNELLEQRIGLEEKLTAYREEEMKDYENILSDEEKILIEKRKRLDLVKQHLESVEKLTKKKQEEKGYTEDILQDLRAQVKELKQIRKQTDDIKDYTASINQTSGDWLGKYLGINKQTQQLGKNLQTPLKYTKDLAKTLSKSVTGVNLMGSAAAKFGEAMRVGLDYTKQTFGVMATLQKGQAFFDQSRMVARQVGVLSADELDEFQSRMTTLSDGTRFTRSELMETYKTLRQSSAAFRQMSKADQTSVTELSKTLERRLGVAATTSAVAMNNLVQTFGKSPEQANKLTASMSLMAKRMNLDVNKALGDFTSQANNLAKFSLPDVGTEFLNLANIQDKVGIGMDAMFGSLEKLSTFEGALTAGSQLNAVFGTSIDLMQVMDEYEVEGPVAGFIKLQQTLQESGIEIDNISRSQMKVLSQAVGLSASDMKKLGKISTAELQKIAAEGGEVSDALQLMNKDQKDGETSAESLAKAQSDLAKALQPIADFLTDLIKGFNTLVGSLGALAPILAQGGPIILGLAMMSRGLGSVASLLGNIPSASTGAGGALSSLGGKVTGLAGHFGKLAKAGIGAMGVMAGVEMAKQEGAGWKAGGILTGAASGALAGSGFGLLGMGVGAAIGAGAAIYSAFEGEQTYISKPTMATVGEKPEMISHRTQRMLGTGDRVSGATSGPTELKLTVNLVTKEGKALATTNIHKTVNKDVETTVNRILDEKFNLIFS